MTLKWFMRNLDIAELTQRSGLPASALRFYEEKGLVESIGRVAGSVGGRYGESLVHSNPHRAYSEGMHAATDLPRRHRLTVDDYYRMAEVGILDPEARVELIDGEIIDMAPPGSPHAATVHYLTEVFVRAVDGTATVLAQNPVRLSKYSEPQPDVALLRRRDDFYRERHPQPDDVLLIVEIAASSLRFDRKTKVPLYARHGIPEMWLIDLRDRRLVRYRAPQQGSYTLVDEPELGTPLELSTLSGIVVDLRRVFG